MTEDKKTILVVDDNNDLSGVLVDKFTAEGFTTVSAADGEQGLAKALELHPDLILLDILMPVLDGWGVLEKLRQDEWGKIAKVILLTNVGDMESISQGLEKGSYEYLVKTDWDLDDVVSKVKQALS